MTFLFLFYMTARLPKDESCSDPRSRRFLLTAKEGAPLDFLSSSFVQSPFKVSKINIMGHLLTIHSRVYHIFIFLSSVLENLFHYPGDRHSLSLYTAFGFLLGRDVFQLHPDRSSADHLCKWSAGKNPHPGKISFHRRNPASGNSHSHFQKQALQPAMHPWKKYCLDHHCQSWCSFQFFCKIWDNWPENTGWTYRSLPKICTIAHGWISAGKPIVNVPCGHSQSHLFFTAARGSLPASNHWDHRS